MSEPRIRRITRRRVAIQSKKTCKLIYVNIDTKTKERVDARNAKVQGRRSATINNDLRLYYSLLDRAMKDLYEIFTMREMQALIEVFDGNQCDAVTLWLWVDGGLIDLWDTVHKSTEISKRWHIDGEGVLNKLQGLSELEAFAIVDWLSTWWRSFDNVLLVKDMLRKFISEDAQYE